jgi:transcriptional regulator with XRE-family HTH domain
MLSGRRVTCFPNRMATNREGLRARVAAEIRAEMARQNLSQMQVAAKLGQAQPWVSRRIKGSASLDLDDLEAFASALNVPTHKLLGWTDGVSGRSG